MNDELRDAAQAVIDTSDDYYTARNGRRCSIEGSDGEKCWIVPFDQFETLRRAVGNPAPLPAIDDRGQIVLWLRRLDKAPFGWRASMIADMLERGEDSTALPGGET